MVSAVLFVIFLFLLVFFYPLVCFFLAVSAWLQKRWAIKGDVSDEKLAAIIDAKTDRQKELAFVISVVLIFFVLAPFLVFWLIDFP